MNFYQSLGYLFFGSRLRRLSELFIHDINKVYQAREIPFEAAWFPIFYLLSINEKVNIREISEALQISHSAVSQMVSNLIDRGFITTECDLDDARKKLICFTHKGRQLLRQVQPVWEAVRSAMQEIADENSDGQQLLNGLTAMENNLHRKPLYARVGTLLKEEVPA